MKYFGTDGIRGIVDKNLSPVLIRKLARGIVNYFNINKLSRKILIGNDTRASGEYILSIIATILVKNNIQIDNLGCCTSPCLAYTTKKYAYPLGLMISASHNSYQYNGLKFFSTNGEKVSEEFEIMFENLMEKRINKFSNGYATVKNVEHLQQDYISKLKNLIKNRIDCLFDCANGASAKVIKQLFPKNEKMHVSPTGVNINLNSGCTHIEQLKLHCIKKHKIGFAFDGDADRVFAVSETGRILNGDLILFILSKFFQTNGDYLVGTIYTNLGLEYNLKMRKIGLIRAGVGDKLVVSAMKNHGSLLGGEESGHIIIKPFTNTGDGVLTAIILSNILALSGLSLDQLISEYKESYQLRKNLTCYANLDYSILADKYNNELVRVIIRKSGTEPVLRVFVESFNKNLAEQTLNDICKKLSLKTK